MKKYDVRWVKVGEEKPLLDEGYEPFAVSAHDTSYEVATSNIYISKTVHRTTDYIYLRKMLGNFYD